MTESVHAADKRRYPDRPFIGVGAVIVQDGKVLLVKRKFEPLAGQWSLPGGAVEVGETLEACLTSCLSIICAGRQEVRCAPAPTLLRCASLIRATSFSTI